MKYEYNGIISNGKLSLQDATKKRMQMDCNTIGDYAVIITIERKKAKRSLEQNRYYWGVVVPMVMQGLTDLGNYVSKDSTHDFIKSEFNYTEFVNENTGEVKRLPQSTTSLNKEQFMVMLDKINIFCLEYFGFTIPEPNTQAQIIFAEHDKELNTTIIY